MHGCALNVEPILLTVCEAPAHAPCESSPRRHAQEEAHNVQLSP